VELANRFAFDIWNLQPISGPSLDGANYASTLSSERGVALVSNGTAGQPYLAGDIVSFTGTGALADGHVAVVMSSTYPLGTEATTPSHSSRRMPPLVLKRTQLSPTGPWAIRADPK